MQTTTLVVPDISCEHCERTVKQALSALPGVSTVTVDIPQKLVTIRYDDKATNLNALKEALAAEDYPVAAVR